jgi:hypothetical protein
VVVDGDEPVDLRFGGAVLARGADGETGVHLREVAHPLLAEAAAVAVGRDDVVLVARAVPADRSLSIRVRDPDGEPAAGVEVTWSPAAEGATASVRTDAEGRATLSGLPPAALTLRAAVPEDRREAWFARTPEGTVVPAGQVVDLAFVRPVVLEGVVSTADGGPVPEAHVRAETDDEAGGSATSDALGRFRLPVDPSWRTVDLEAVAGVGDGGMLLGTASDVAPGAPGIRVVVAPHDGIVR